MNMNNRNTAESIGDWNAPSNFREMAESDYDHDLPVSRDETKFVKTVRIITFIASIAITVFITILIGFVLSLTKPTFISMTFISVRTSCLITFIVAMIASAYLSGKTHDLIRRMIRVDDADAYAKLKTRMISVIISPIIVIGMMVFSPSLIGVYRKISDSGTGSSLYSDGSTYVLFDHDLYRGSAKLSSKDGTIGKPEWNNDGSVSISRRYTWEYCGESHDRSETINIPSDFGTGNHNPDAAMPACYEPGK